VQVRAAATPRRARSPPARRALTAPAAARQFYTLAYNINREALGAIPVLGAIATSFSPY